MSFQRRFKFHFLFLKKRFVSYLIDHFLIVLLNIFCTFAYFEYFTQDIFHQYAISLNGLTKAYQFNFAPIYFAYFTSSFLLLNGQTPGQKYMGLMVIKTNSITNAKLTFSQSFRRSLINYLCYQSYFTLFLLCLFQKEFKGLPDILSGTKLRFETPVLKQRQIEKSFLKAA